MTSLTATLPTPPLPMEGPSLLLSGLLPRLAGAVGMAGGLVAAYLLVVGG